MFFGVTGKKRTTFLVPTLDPALISTLVPALDPTLCSTLVLYRNGRRVGDYGIGG